MKYEELEETVFLVEEESHDLRERTLEFALRIVKLYGALPKCRVSNCFALALPSARTIVKPFAPDLGLNS